MTITPQQLIALLPLLIVGLTVVVVMLGIAWRRDHFINATLTVIGLNRRCFRCTLSAGQAQWTSPAAAG